MTSLSFQGVKVKKCKDYTQCWGESRKEKFSQNIIGYVKLAQHFWKSIW